MSYEALKHLAERRIERDRAPEDPEPGVRAPATEGREGGPEMTVPTCEFVKVRKKPVVVEALQMTSAVIYAMMNGVSEIPSGVRFVDTDQEGLKVTVETLEGRMVANVGDYLMRGVKGELYPCQADIFEATYEAVKEKDLGR